MRPGHDHLIAIVVGSWHLRRALADDENGSRRPASRMLLGGPTMRPQLRAEGRYCDQWSKFRAACGD
jgi:hypothetical protein